MGPLFCFLEQDDIATVDTAGIWEGQDDLRILDRDDGREGRRTTDTTLCGADRAHIGNPIGW